MRKDWTEVALGEVCRLEKGSLATMKAEAGQYPLVVTASYRRTSSSYQFDEPAVCIPLVSSTGHGNAAIHRIHYQDGRFALANILVAVIPHEKSGLLAKYLWRYLSAQKDRILVPLMQIGRAHV
jgi:type I restriction enzyme S subunit